MSDTMKEVYIEGKNGDRDVAETILVEDARELVDGIRKIAAEKLGVRSYTIDNTSGAVVAPIGLKDMDADFAGICSVRIVPYNKAGE